MEQRFYETYGDFQDFELDSLETRIKLPYVLKNKRLIGPGKHNGLNYKTPILKKIYHNTQWNKHSRALFYDHVDMSKGGGARTWIGEIKNEKLRPDGSVYGDLYILNKQAAINLEYGAKFGVSVKVQGRSDPITRDITDGVYANWSLVFDPADKETYLNEEGWCTFLNFEEKTMDIEENNEGDGKSEVELSELQKTITKLSDELAELKKKMPKDEPDAEDEMAKKKYPKPRKEDEEEMDDKEGTSDEFDKGEPKGDKPSGDAPASESATQLSDEELEDIFENESYREFVKGYMKKNKGATIADAAKAWKKSGKANAEAKELSELKQKVEALELEAKPKRSTVKHGGGETTFENAVKNISDEELDKAFAEHVIQAAYKEDRWQ